MKDKELIGIEWELRVSPSVVVAELNFEDAGGERFHDSSHLAAAKAVRREVLG